MKRYIIAIIIGFIIMTLGISLFAVEIMDYEYINDVPSNVIVKKEIFNYKINNETIYINGRGNEVNIIIDEKVSQGSIKTEVSYYANFVFVLEKQGMFNNDKLITYDVDYKINAPKFFYEFTVSSLKNKKVYNYSVLNNINIDVFVNPIDLEYIKKYDGFINNQKFTIIDETVICAQALEEIAIKDGYAYYLNCIKSHTIFLKFADGKKISLRKALDEKKVTIEELINEGLEVYKEPINY